MSRRRYVSDTLVHWTGRTGDGSAAFMALKAICEETTLRLTYCPNYVQDTFRPQTAMACFTDIPLSSSREHCSRFGRCGIGFKKAAMIRYGANPVFYTTGTHFTRVRAIASLLARMKDLEKDREWLEKVEPYRFTEEETVSLLEVMEYLQEYSYKNVDAADYVTYHQREWRLAFSSLPFASGASEPGPGMSSIYVRNGQSYKTFTFAPADVAYLVVPLRFWWAARPIAARLGCGLKVLELAVLA